MKLQTASLLMLALFALLLCGFTSKIRDQQREIDELNQQRYDLLVKHEGWRRVEGLPLPIPPRPKNRY